MTKGGYVYILASGRNGTLYVGVTSNLLQRTEQHTSHTTPGFTDKYQVSLLVWYQQHDDIESAIQREKQLKNWHRDWKLKLIEELNPDWKDLAKELF